MKRTTSRRVFIGYVLRFALLLFASLIVSNINFYALAKSEYSLTGSKGNEEQLRNWAKEVLIDVGQIRGMPTKQAVEIKLSSPAEIKDFVIGRFMRENTSEKLLATQKTLTKLGLIPPKMNLEKYLTDLYTEQIGGYYDQYKKILYLADWIPAEFQKLVMAHELLHALQDQYFDLPRLINPLKDPNDVHMAKMALVEGEATAVMMEYLLKPQGISLNDFPDLKLLMLEQLKGQLTQIPNSKLQQVPKVIQENILFPYIYGLSFLQAVRKSYPWERVSAMYNDPPSSTEQIMHPEKYLTKRDNPMEVILTYAMVQEVTGTDWKLADQDVLGEFNIYVLLKEFLQESEAVKASEGWGGDRYLLLENQSKGDSAFIFFSRWDDEKEAEEFFTTATKLMEKRYGGKRQLSITQDFRNTNAWKSEQSSGIWVQRDEKNVLLMEGLPEGKLKELSVRLLKQTH